MSGSQRKECFYKSSCQTILKGRWMIYCWTKWLSVCPGHAAFRINTVQTTTTAHKSSAQLKIAPVVKEKKHTVPLHILFWLLRQRDGQVVTTCTFESGLALKLPSPPDPSSSTTELYRCTSNIRKHSWVSYDAKDNDQIISPLSSSSSLLTSSPSSSSFVVRAFTRRYYCLPTTSYRCNCRLYLTRIARIVEIGCTKSSTVNIS